MSCGFTETEARLLGALIGLSRAAEGNEDLLTKETDELMLQGFLAVRNRDPEILSALTEKVRKEKFRIVPDCALCADPCGRTADYDFCMLQEAPEEIRFLKLSLLSALFSAADSSRLHDAAFLRKALVYTGMQDVSPERLSEIVREAKAED